ncbi:TPA: hypothetical protein SMP92_002429 [Pseudomonas putida]|nr:hypothetical protein [Pseudomonas putida]
MGSITCNHSGAKTCGRPRCNAADADRAGDSAYQRTSPCRQRQISSIDTSTPGLATEISTNPNYCSTDCARRTKGASHHIEFFYCDISHYYNPLCFLRNIFKLWHFGCARELPKVQSRNFDRIKFLHRQTNSSSDSLCRPKPSPARSVSLLLHP